MIPRASTRPATRSLGRTSSCCATSSHEKGGKRSVELFVAPRGNIRYTLDGSEPRDGTAYDGPIAIGDGDVLLRAFAEADGLEAKTDFRFPAKGKKGVQIDDVKPGRLVSRTGRKLDSRTKTFEGLKQAAEKSVTFEGIVLTVGQGNQVIAHQRGRDSASMPPSSKLCSTKVLEKFAPDTPVTMTFRKAHFASGHDLKDFAGKLGIELAAGGRRAMSDKPKTVDFGAPDKFGAHLFRVEIPRRAERVGRDRRGLRLPRSGGRHPA